MATLHLQLSAQSWTSFQTVGFFITQDEVHETIEFCLEKMVSWAPRWKPLVFLMDQDSAEILAVQTVFPDAFIFMCDFHLKMDWKKKFRSLGGNSAEWSGNRDWGLNEEGPCSKIQNFGRVSFSRCCKSLVNTKNYIHSWTVLLLHCLIWSCHISAVSIKC